MSQFLDQLLLIDYVSYLIENQDRLMEVRSIHRVQSAEYRSLKRFLELLRTLLVVIALHVLTDMLAVAIDKTDLIKDIIDDLSKPLYFLVLLLYHLHQFIILILLK